MESLSTSMARLGLEVASEDEFIEDSDEEVLWSFRFFDLPAELRRKILDFVFHLDKPLDIDLRVSRLLSLLPVSKQFHAEATQAFYGSNTFRLLPTHGRAASKRAMPLIKCFPRYCRAEITSMEFRLGPFWTSPPPCWVIDDSLGLEDALSLRVLKVFIEIDPSHAIFNGFRSARLSYTDFCGALLSNIIRRLPSLREVQIDSYPSVTRDLPLMGKMVQVALEANMRISWGPGQEENNGKSSQRGSMSQGMGMVPFYSSSPFHRHATEGASVSA